MLNLIFKGGILMWPILACSLISLTIILEKLHYFHRLQREDNKWLGKIRTLVGEEKVDQALNYCERMSGPLAHLIKVTLINRHLSPSRKEKILSQVGAQELEKLEKHLSALGVISHISPLLGLFGTVVGMIKVFIAVEQVGGPVDPGLLAGGIWEALLTTAAGLAVAIPTLVMYHYLEGRVGHIYRRMKMVPLYLAEPEGGEF